MCISLKNCTKYNGLYFNLLTQVNSARLHSLAIANQTNKQLTIETVYISFWLKSIFPALKQTFEQLQLDLFLAKKENAN
jgi:hypothetical protein